MHVENTMVQYLQEKNEQPHQMERLRVRSKGAGALGLRQGKAVVFYLTSRLDLCESGSGVCWPMIRPFAEGDLFSRSFPPCLTHNSRRQKCASAPNILDVLFPLFCFCSCPHQGSISFGLRSSGFFGNILPGAHGALNRQKVEHLWECWLC